MDTIDISQNIQDFKQVFEQEVTFRDQNPNGKAY